MTAAVHVDQAPAWQPVHVLRIKSTHSSHTLQQATLSLAEYACSRWRAGLLLLLAQFMHTGCRDTSDRKVIAAGSERFILHRTAEALQAVVAACPTPHNTAGLCLSPCAHTPRPPQGCWQATPSTVNKGYVKQPCQPQTPAAIPTAMPWQNIWVCRYRGNVWGLPARQSVFAMCAMMQHTQAQACRVKRGTSFTASCCEHFTPGQKNCGHRQQQGRHALAGHAPGCKAVVANVC